MGGLRANTVHHGKVVATQQPQVRTIFWNGSSKGEQFIFPHTLFVAYYTRHESNNTKYWLNRLHVSFSLDPIDLNNQEQPIYGLPIANTDVGNAICFYEWPIKQDPYEFIKAVVGQFWSSPFQDYGDGFSHWLNTYKASSNGVKRAGSFREEWKAATAKRDWQWLWNQQLHQAPYIVNLKKLFASNHTNTQETDWFPNLGLTIPKEMIQARAEEKWRAYGCPDGIEYEKAFWLEAEAELKKEIHSFQETS